MRGARKDSKDSCTRLRVVDGESFHSDSFFAFVCTLTDTLTSITALRYKQASGLINSHFPGPGNAYMDSIARPVLSEMDLIRESSPRL